MSTPVAILGKPYRLSVAASPETPDGTPSAFVVAPGGVQHDVVLTEDANAQPGPEFARIWRGVFIPQVVGDHTETYTLPGGGVTARDFVVYADPQAPGVIVAPDPQAAPKPGSGAWLVARIAEIERALDDLAMTPLKGTEGRTSMDLTANVKLLKERRAEHLQALATLRNGGHPLNARRHV